MFNDNEESLSDEDDEDGYGDESEREPEKASIDGTIDFNQIIESELQKVQDE
jgi:hypothetical protein